MGNHDIGPQLPFRDANLAKPAIFIWPTAFELEVVVDRHDIMEDRRRLGTALSTALELPVEEHYIERTFASFSVVLTAVLQVVPMPEQCNDELAAGRYRLQKTDCSEDTGIHGTFGRKPLSCVPCADVIAAQGLVSQGSSTGLRAESRFDEFGASDVGRFQQRSIEGF